jgi:hypothetical protein
MVVSPLKVSHTDDHIQLSPPDIFLSHDWPAGIEHQGNLRELLQRKKFLRDDINKVRRCSLQDATYV